MQRQISAVFFTTLSVFTLAHSPSAWAWGHRGHQVLASVGAQLVDSSSEFWVTNAKQVGTLSTVPDEFWKNGTSADEEKPTHWFQIDAYFSSPTDFDQFPHVYNEAVKRFQEDTVTTNGTAPWRVQQFYDLAVAALKKWRSSNRTPICWSDDSLHRRSFSTPACQQKL